MEQFKQYDTEVVAIVVDPVEQNAKVVAELKLTFPILADTDRRVLDAYDLRHDKGASDGAIARPATFVIDREGVVRWRDLTDNYRLRPGADEVLAVVAGLPKR